VRKVLFLVGVVGMVGCGANPITPTATPTVATVVDASAVALHWPVADPSGEYGKEDPNYPPDPSQCPVGWNVTYNGHNFVCRAPVCCDAVFPH
jgi:hypothetical protein